MADLGSVAADDFARHLGESFTVTLDNDEELTLVLTEVEKLGGESSRAATGFSLIFEGGDPSMEQATHPVTHPRLGSLDLFLVPIGERDGVRKYQVIFTRLP